MSKPPQLQPIRPTPRERDGKRPQLRVFLVHPTTSTARIINAPAEVIMRRHGWAIVRGRRHLLGGTAFFTEASAKRSKLARLVKQSKALPFLWRMHPHLAHAVREQLKDPKHVGWTVRVA